MANSNPNQRSDPSAAQQPSNTVGSHRMAYLIGIVVVVLVIGVLFLVGSGGAPGLATTTASQSSSLPIYLSTSATQQLLGSPILNYSANYSVTSIYNYSSSANLTLLEAVVPALSGNVTNGWATVAFGSGPNNASMEYFALQTANPSRIAALFAQAISSAFPTLPQTSQGSYGGMNYTYEVYSNSTGSYQNLIGWKGGYVLAAQLEANNFTASQSQMATLVANTVP